MALPRMRTADGVLKELREQDPETRVSLNFLRGLINSGAIPVVLAGHRKLVNMDLVFDYLANQGTEHPITYSRGGSSTIRKVV